MSGWYDFGRHRSLSVAERRAMAEREIKALRARGVPIAPVTIEGRAIARTFWGRAWCENLESYSDFEYRLPRGRSYVRNAGVIDLQASDLEVRAQVCGTSVYQVTIAIEPLPPARWKAICRDCAGGIDSLVELLQGRFSDAVMQRICRQETGLFPAPSEIRMSCSCPDWATMCKHVAAALYGIGARLDTQPELLFRLRGVDGNDMVAGLGRDLPLADRKAGDDGDAADGRLPQGDDLSALFGLEMEIPEDPPTAPTLEPAEPGTRAPSARARRKAGTVKQPDRKAGKAPARKPPAAKRGQAGASASKAAGPEPAGKPERAPRKPVARRKRKAQAPAAKFELTPDGYVKWWK